MKRIRMTDRQVFVLGIIVIVLGGLLLARWAPAAPTPISTRSDARDGALALRLWLQASGYEVRPFNRAPDLPAYDAIFTQGRRTGTPAQMDALVEWVRGGGLLIVGGGFSLPFSDRVASGQHISVYNAFDITGFSVGTNSGSFLTAPTLTSPPMDIITLADAATLESANPALTVHAAEAAERVFVASLDIGRGRAWFVGSDYPFTNEGLQTNDNAALILNMIAGLPPGAVIGFDERLGDDTLTLAGWLWGTSPGRGILLFFALTFAYLALRGRRLGAAIPLPEDRLLREPAEYVRAMANLYRRSGQQGVLLNHYHQQLRRRLINRYGLDASLDDDALVEAVARRDPALDTAALHDLLRRLAASSASEPLLIRAAADMDAWVKAAFKD